jgi:hypothetical protein
MPIHLVIVLGGVGVKRENGDLEAASSRKFGKGDVMIKRW